MTGNGQNNLSIPWDQIITRKLACATLNLSTLTNTRATPQSWYTHLSQINATSRSLKV